uniref:NADH-ubiquinone oxidoreductase chain 6 n=1 Tax=Cleridae sp. 1 ACP-2013 TaxID=1434446 RepID=A0A3G5FNR0_9CUCU|nr:NADH dehydrogenase subunit 6 [Cleridae sp. 1 ACP-2013]
MKFILILLMFSSFSILFLSHPMSLGMILLIQTILTSLIISLLNFNFWFSYILFLVMVGGMLVLFIYMTSIASNEKFLFSNFLIMLVISSTILMMMMMMMDSFMFNLNLLNNEILMKNDWTKFNLSMNKFFNYPNLSIFCISIIYLLMTLIAVVKISNLNLGPLRPKN